MNNDEDVRQMHLHEVVYHLETLVDNFLEGFTDAQQSQILLAWTILQAVMEDLAPPPDTPDGP